MGEQVGREDPHFEGVEDRAAVEAGLPGLTEREALALRLRFVEDLTQSQIAEQIGCSQVHVSRILRTALQRLRESAAAERRVTQLRAGSVSGSRRPHLEAEVLAVGGLVDAHVVGQLLERCAQARDLEL